MCDNFLFCISCGTEIIRDSVEHDHCIIVNCGEDLICADCPWKCPTNCNECVVCEYECYCMECGETIELKKGETPQQQGEWFTQDDELKLCISCEQDQSEK